MTTTSCSTPRSSADLLKGLGLRRDGASIDYRERSPLVLPPGKELNQLPSPEDAAKAKQVAELAGRSRTSSASSSARKPSASASRSNPASTTGRCWPDKMTEWPPPAPTGSKAGEAPGTSGEDAQRQSTARRARLQGLHEHVQDRAVGAEGRVRALHRRAAAHQPDRAAARLSDALADPALRRRQGQVDGADRSTGTSPSNSHHTGSSAVRRSASCPGVARDAADPPANIRETAFAKPDR